MGHHTNDNGEFQSDKKPKLDEEGFLEPDKIVLSFKDPAARKALRVYAALTERKDLAEDIIWRLHRMFMDKIREN